MILNREQIEFLQFTTRDKKDFSKIKECVSVYEKRNNRRELIGLAGTVKRYEIVNSVFLAIGQEFQGKGFGTELFKKLWENEKPKPMLTCYKDNTPALRIYLKYYFFVPYFHNKVLGIPKWWVQDE